MNCWSSAAPVPPTAVSRSVLLPRWVSHGSDAHCGGVYSLGVLLRRSCLGMNYIYFSSNKNNDLDYGLTPAHLYQCILGALPESLDRQGNPLPHFRTLFLSTRKAEATWPESTTSLQGRIFMLELHPHIKQGANIGIKPDFTEQSLSWTWTCLASPGQKTKRLQNTVQQHMLDPLSKHVHLTPIPSCAAGLNWLQHPETNSVGPQRPPYLQENTGYQNAGVLWHCWSLRISYTFPWPLWETQRLLKRQWMPTGMLQIMSNYIRSVCSSTQLAPWMSAESNALWKGHVSKMPICRHCCRSRQTPIHWKWLRISQPATWDFLWRFARSLTPLSWFKLHVLLIFKKDIFHVGMQKPMHCCTEWLSLTTQQQQLLKCHVRDVCEIVSGWTKIKMKLKDPPLETSLPPVRFFSILRKGHKCGDAQSFEIKCKENCTRCHADTDNSKPNNNKSQQLSRSTAHFNVNAGSRQNMEKNRNKVLKSKVKSAAAWARLTPELCHRKHLLTQGVIPCLLWNSRGFAFPLSPSLLSRLSSVVLWWSETSTPPVFPACSIHANISPGYSFLPGDFPAYQAVRACLGKPGFPRTRLPGQGQTLACSFHPPHVSTSCRQTDRQTTSLRTPRFASWLG